MKDTTIKAVAAAALLAAGGALAQEEAAPGGFDWTPGEGISFDEQPVLSAEFGLAFDSRYMTYGVIDGKDPILRPSATATFFDWVYFGVESIFDTTKAQGRKGGYGNRAMKYTTLDAIAGVAHEFDLGESLGTLGVDVNYIYEYIRRHHDSMDDTQYINLELSLGDLMLEPTLAIERDIMADEGTYANLNIGHTFTLVGDEGEDEEEEAKILTFKPSIGQGVGNSLRTKGYFSETTEGFSHGGLMDTTLKGELEWTICAGLKLGAYIAYADYWLDGNMRDAARDYNAEWGHRYDHSYNIYGGLALTCTF